MSGSKDQKSVGDIRIRLDTTINPIQAKIDEFVASLKPPTNIPKLSLDPVQVRLNLIDGLLQENEELKRAMTELLNHDHRAIPFITSADLEPDLTLQIALPLSQIRFSQCAIDLKEGALLAMKSHRVSDADKVMFERAGIWGPIAKVRDIIARASEADKRKAFGQIDQEGIDLKAVPPAAGAGSMLFAGAVDTQVSALKERDPASKGR